MRTNTVTDSKSSHPMSYDSGYSAYSVSGLDNAFADSSSTTYATINLTRGSNAETIIYYNFSFSIPTEATINSITATAKCYINQTSSNYISSRQIRLYSGSTAMGTAATVANNTTVLSISAGTWTASQINNAKIRLYAKRSTRNTNTGYYFRFYGATLTVNYTYNETIYEVTSQSDVAGVSMSPSSADITAGNGRTFEILGDLTNVIVEDNSVDVTSQLVPQTGGSVSATYSLTNVSEDHFIHFYLRGDKIYIKKNSAAFQVGSATSSYYDTFNVVATVPAGTIVEGDTVRVVLTNIRRWHSGSYVSLGNYEVEFERTATYGSTRQYAYYEGTSGKGVSVIQVTSNYQLEIRPYDSSQTNAEYDGTLKVYKIENNVWVEAEEIYIKVNGSWQSVSKVYKKENGTWEEQDKSAMFDPNALYIKG